LRVSDPVNARSSKRSASESEEKRLIATTGKEGESRQHASKRQVPLALVKKEKATAEKTPRDGDQWDLRTAHQIRRKNASYQKEKISCERGTWQEWTKKRAGTKPQKLRRVPHIKKERSVPRGHHRASCRKGLPGDVTPYTRFKKEDGR